MFSLSRSGCPCRDREANCTKWSVRGRTLGEDKWLVVDDDGSGGDDEREGEDRISR